MSHTKTYVAYPLVLDSVDQLCLVSSIFNKLCSLLGARDLSVLAKLLNNMVSPEGVTVGFCQVVLNRSEEGSQ